MTYKAAHFTWQVRRQLGHDPGRRRQGRDRRLQGHHDARHEGPGPRREVADRRRDRPERLAQEGRRAAEVAQDPEGRPGVGPGPARQGPPQRGAGRARLPDRRRAGLRRQRRLLPRRPGQRQVLAEVRRRGRRVAPARVRRSSRSCTPAAFDSRKLTPGSLLLDVTTEFNRREDWAPRDADQLERGPVLVRKALQYSLNIPAIRALQRVGNSQVDKTAEALGLRFTGGREAYLQAGLAGALGTVEVRPVDLTSAYGALANGGVRVPPRMILKIEAPDGKVVWQAPDGQGHGRGLAAGRLPRHRHPRRQHGQEAEPDLVREARGLQRQGRDAGVRWRSRRAPRTTRATSRRTASSRRRPTTTPVSRSVSGWATATTPTRARRSRPSRSPRPPRCGTRSCATTRRAGRSPTSSRPRASSRPPSTPGPAASPGRGRRPRRPPGSSPGRSRAPRRRSIPTACSTASRAAATGSTSSRPSSGRRAGTRTSPTGCAAPAADRGGPASTTRGRPTSGSSRRGAARSRGRATGRGRTRTTAATRAASTASTASRRSRAELPAPTPPPAPAP